MIPYFQFNPAKIRFTPASKNKYFKGTFSQIKYEYGPFTIYNPILSIPPNVNIEEWSSQVEWNLTQLYFHQMGLSYKAFHKKQIPFSVQDVHGPLGYIGIKISGVWTTEIGYGLNYIWLKSEEDDPAPDGLDAGLNTDTNASVITI